MLALEDGPLLLEIKSEVDLVRRLEAGSQI
jgi:hypothetical protein